MCVRRIAAALAAALLGIGSALVTGGPAAAGGWAMTVLDPLPDRLKWRQPYTVGFWVLQHGTHAFWGEPERLGEVGIKLLGPRGQTLTFRGSPLSEPAHFATAIHIPQPGPWRIVGVQGVFADFDIGSVDAEGWLRTLPVPVAVPERTKDWTGPIRPPQVPVDPNRDPFTPIGTAPIGAGIIGGIGDPAGRGTEETDRRSQAEAADPAGQGRTATLAAVAAALIVAGLLWNAYRSRSLRGLVPAGWRRRADRAHRRSMVRP